jgi:Protein of unknown function (DUF3604)
MRWEWGERMRRGGAVGLCALAIACGEEETPLPEAPPATAELPAGEPAAPDPARPPTHRAFFGDLHFESALSLDAYSAGTRAGPDEIYRYAQGEWIVRKGGDLVRLRKALDFAAVADRAELLGLGPAMADPADPLAATPLARQLTGDGAGTATRAFRRLVAAAAGGHLPELLPSAEVTRAERAGWRSLIEAAERHDDPGRFTTFVAYRWAPGPRVTPERRVVFADAEVPELPYSALDSGRPQALRARLETWQREGHDAIALRASHPAQWVRGPPDSEVTLPLIAREGRPAPPPRIGFSDDARRLGVWAESNTRSAIFAALRRGEVFVTSGPRIRVRLFAGQRFPHRLHERPDALARAARRGVAMGGTLSVRSARAPTLFVWAQRDPRSAPLERIQIVKGWLRDGRPAEATFDVACSDGLQPDPDSHRCPDNGATLDLESCQHSTLVGAGQLSATWTDPDWVPGVRAVYYARVLENPSCRRSPWEANRRDQTPAPIPVAIRERAWSAPVWIEPADANAP